METLVLLGHLSIFQGGSLPDTLPWSVDDVPVGTATIGLDGRMYLRWFGGEFVATVVHKPDGSKIIYNINGKVIPKLPEVK
jgi:hypothetical protein